MRHRIMQRCVIGIPAGRALAAQQYIIPACSAAAFAAALQSQRRHVVRPRRAQCGRARARSVPVSLLCTVCVRSSAGRVWLAEEFGGAQPRGAQRPPPLQASQAAAAACARRAAQSTRPHKGCTAPPLVFRLLPVALSAFVRCAPRPPQACRCAAAGLAAGPPVPPAARGGLAGPGAAAGMMAGLHVRALLCNGGGGSWRLRGSSGESRPS
jgi:hypothetical protein